MMSTQMDETFAAALREVLVEQVQSATTHRLWPMSSRRRIATAGAVLLLAAGGGGIAYATGVFTPAPGGPVVTHLATPVTVTGTGTENVQVGIQPAGTNAIDFSLTCLTAGDFGFADGSMSCGPADVATRSATATDTLPVAAGQDSMTITAAEGTRWRLTATYSSITSSAWGINASGQTYGVANQHGTPDLVEVQATNGRSGYAYAQQLIGPQPTTPTQAATLSQTNPGPRTITVYESDGKTPIGVFRTASSP